MNMLTSPPAQCRTFFELLVSRRVAHTVSGRGLPDAGDSLPLGRSNALTFDAPFELVGGGWRAPGRLVCSSRGRLRSERIDITVTACEVRIVPHSTRAPQWGTRRLLRYFQLAHDAADAMVRSLSSTEISRAALDSPVAGASTLRLRTVAKQELTHGFHP